MVDIIVMKSKVVNIDFLYLDLNTCDRCMETENTLDEAVEELSRPLKSLGYNIVVNKLNVINATLAEKHKFLSSPTIRVNGHDILGEIKENLCGDCSDISGNATTCRVFVYDGKTYNEPPKAMIMDGILKCIYGGESKNNAMDESYVLPENLNEFFAGSSSGKSRCCGDEV